ncbi:MAG: type II toxin-antitoxin system VapC family toxin [Merismopediaceae bacterium]|nr:type II toxin-antitoxin system VapC family toxin [Merismopediaceae bacterium]
MKFLLDTHVMLWFLNDDPKLAPNIRDEIEECNQVFVSIISLWEVAIKFNIGKLKLGLDFRDLSKALDDSNITILNIIVSDFYTYINLPLHHKDPFDRLLISQAINHSLILVSRDQALDDYPIQRLWS